MFIAGNGETLKQVLNELDAMLLKLVAVGRPHGQQSACSSARRAVGYSGRVPC